MFLLLDLLQLVVCILALPQHLYRYLLCILQHLIQLDNILLNICMGLLEVRLQRVELRHLSTIELVQDLKLLPVSATMGRGKEGRVRAAVAEKRHPSFDHEASSIGALMLVVFRRQVVLETEVR